MPNKIEISDKMRETLERILAMEPFNIEMYGYNDLDFSLLNVDSSPEELGNGIYEPTNHPCGTTYCLAGKLAADDGYPEAYRDLISRGFFRHQAYIARHLEIDSTIEDFLFDAEWPDDLDQAKKRAQLVLDNTGEIDFEHFIHSELLPYGIYTNQADFEAAQHE